MSAPHADEIIAGYISRLEAAASGLGPSRREELVADIRQHIAEARSAFEEETDADVLNLLDRLGAPSDLVAAALGDATPPAAPLVAPGVGLLDVLAVVMLLLFWPAGVVLTWLSTRFTLFDKLAITLVPGLVVFVRLLPGPHWWVAGPVLVIVLTPFISAMYAAIRLATGARRALAT